MSRYSASKPHSPLNTGATRSSPWEVVLVLVFFATLLSWWNWPVAKQFIPGLQDPPRHSALGVLLKVSYLGGFGHSTQIDTETGSYLLRGVPWFSMGARMELSSTFFGTSVCEEATAKDPDNCAELLSVGGRGAP